MNFKQLISKYASGNLPIEQLPEVAYKGLDEGYDSPSLIILAGIDKNENYYVIDKYFKLALGELKITIPDSRQSALQYSSFLADEIIANNGDVYYGVREIITNGFKRYDNLYKQIFFTDVYIVYHDCEDILDSWVEGKSDKKLLIELKQDLLQELIKWNDFVKRYLSK